MSTRYNLMSLSSTLAPDGTYFPDPLTLNLSNFVFSNAPQQYYMTQGDINRIDLLMYNVYGFPQYDDVILWLNNIDYLNDTEPGQVLYLPLQSDLESFFSSNAV